MNHLFIDFETRYSTADGYTLKKMDIVSYVRDPRFKVFGLGFQDTYSKPGWLPEMAVSNFIQMIKEGCGWNEIALVGHNIKFDGFILKEKYGVVPGRYVDTKGMSRAVLGKSVKSHHLATLAKHFGLQSKGVMKTDGLESLTVEQEKELAEYCLHDVELCREIYSQLAKDFPQSQNEVMHRTIDMFINPKLKLNVPLLVQASKEEAERREKIFEEIGIEKAEFASNKKFPLLLAARGYEVPTKRSPKTGKSIPALALGDPEFLEMLEEGDELLKRLCEARVAAKSTLLETRSAKLAAIGRSGTWPFDVEFSGANQTHRFSGGSGAGGNPQNFTRDSALRTAVEAPEGHSLIVGDFANIELRIVAYLSRDPGLMEAIEKDIDLYCDFASVFFGRKITKADEKERRFAKIAVLGLGYNMGFKKFAKTVRVQTGEKLTEETARRAVDLYRRKYSKVPELWEFLNKHIHHINGTSQRLGSLPVQIGDGAITLPSGLRMLYPNLHQEPGERGRMEWVYDVYRKGNLEHAKLYGGKVLENISQGLAGEICKLAMLPFGDSVTGLVHDEIHLVVPTDQAEIAAHALEEAMSTSPEWFPNICLKAEVGIGKNWKETK